MWSSEKRKANSVPAMKIDEPKKEDEIDEDNDKEKQPSVHLEYL